MTRTAAIILTYRPDREILRRALASVGPQVDRTLIVNNGERWDDEALLRSLAAPERQKVEVLWLDANLGVGAGHNRGIAWAQRQGCSHVLILDHDSVPRADMVAQLMKALEGLRAKGVAACAVGPRYVDRYTGNVSEFVRLGHWKPKRVACDHPDAVVETDFVISSGALIPLSVLGAVGYMNEDFFIDHVDTEWVFRAKARGFRAFGACGALMEHGLGTDTIAVWLGRTRRIPLHSPERHYYTFRNGLLMMGMPHTPRRWIANDFVRMLAMAVLYPIFAPMRLRRLRYMALGVWHGLRGTGGSLG